MSPASSVQPRPALAYAVWLDSLTRAGWDAAPATKRAAVAAALGRVSAEPIVARWPSPRSDCSAMDGIAVSAAVLAGHSPAGRATGDTTTGDTTTGDTTTGDTTTGDTTTGDTAVRLPAGSFTWVDTGDAMPDGADTV